MRAMPGPLTDCYCRDGNATCEQCETNGYPYSWGLCPGCYLHNGSDSAVDKHLTDAECAAEYWRAEAEHTGMRNGEGVGWSSAEVMDALEHEVEVWHRFATHPHADEVEA